MIFPADLADVVRLAVVELAASLGIVAPVALFAFEQAVRNREAFDRSMSAVDAILEDGRLAHGR